MDIESIKKKIEEDSKFLNEQEIEKFFDNFRNDTGTASFIKYYNRTVLDKEKIDFKEFVSPKNWAIRGIDKETIEYFNKN